MQQLSVAQRLRSILSNYDGVRREGGVLYAGRSGICAHYPNNKHMDDETLHMWVNLDLVVKGLRLSWDMETPLDPNVESLDNLPNGWSLPEPLPTFIHPFGVDHEKAECQDESASSQSEHAQGDDSDKGEPAPSTSPISTDEAGDYTIDVLDGADESGSDADVGADQASSGDATDHEDESSSSDVGTASGADNDIGDGSEDPTGDVAGESGESIVETVTSGGGSEAPTGESSADGASETIEEAQTEDGSGDGIAPTDSDDVSSSATTVGSRDEDSGDYLDDLNVAQLKEECARLDLPKTGKRDDLVKRIRTKLSEG